MRIARCFLVPILPQSGWLRGWKTAAAQESSAEERDRMGFSVRSVSRGLSSA